MAKSKQKRTEAAGAVENELEAIKRLLILFLMKTGTSQDEIALALQVDRSAISRTIPSRKVKPYVWTRM